MRKWLITIAVTAVSTYALDATATAVGLLLVASGLLDGLSVPAAAALLLASYGLWALGMRANLRANWELLSRTGTSTNAFSKAAFHVARGRARRLAVSLGYVLTELAKEAAYYAGALGASAFTDAITSVDAIVFLAGTNVGAAAYEAAVARGTWLLLGRRGSMRPKIHA
jgi:membrane protease YdiL (CAAX protease family)